MTPDDFDDEPPCPACQAPANLGLCHSEYCRRAVLPQITSNAGLVRLMAEADYNPYDTLRETPDASHAALPPLNTPGRHRAKQADRAKRLVAEAFGAPRRGNRSRSKSAA